MIRLRPALQVWLLAFAVCVAAVIFSFFRVDVPLAAFCARFSGRLTGLGQGLGSAVLLSLETATVIALVFVRLIRGRLPPYAEALAVACLVSICAYAVGDGVLKLFFGIPNPDSVASGARHAVNFWQGSRQSGFPSGHMMLAAGFAGVFMRLYRVSIWPLSFLLCVAATLLIVGGWHFLSDVIAGTFLGISVGLLAGQLWIVHSSQRG